VATNKLRETCTGLFGYPLSAFPYMAVTFECRLGSPLQVCRQAVSLSVQLGLPHHRNPRRFRQKGNISSTVRCDNSLLLAMAPKHKDEEGLTSDPRFQAVQADPRFKRLPEVQDDLEEDERFAKLYTDPRFARYGDSALKQRGKR